MARQYRFLRDLNRVFLILTLLFVVVATFWAYTTTPALVTTPAGVAVALLVACYATWECFWLLGRPGLLAESVRWRLLAWSVNLALGLALLRFSPPFIALLYILAGQSFYFLRMPLAPIGLLATAGIVWLVQHGGALSPPPRSAEDWAKVAGNLLSLGLLTTLGVSFERLITARIRNERLIGELRESQARLRRAAEGERELAILRERERLARDLHDAVGHALVLLAVKIEAAQRLGRVDLGRAEAELEATKGLVRETMDELRRTVGSLRAAPLDGRSLAAAVEADARETAERAGLRARVACEEVGGLTAAQEEALWRVAREALTNAVKHAGAGELAVTLARRDGCVALEVRDDGRGLARARANGRDEERAGHFGIRGMYERMELVGGRLVVAPAPGGGTRVRAELPAGPAGGEGCDGAR